MPMQHFTHDDLQPSAATLLFIKQYARMCNLKKNTTHGNNHFPVIAVC
jgi:hypothetical protein